MQPPCSHETCMWELWYRGLHTPAELVIGQSLGHCLCWERDLCFREKMGD